jgi:hypothetical protein
MTFNQRYLAHQDMAFQWLRIRGKQTTSIAVVRTMNRYTHDELSAMVDDLTGASCRSTDSTPLNIDQLVNGPQKD